MLKKNNFIKTFITLMFKYHTDLENYKNSFYFKKLKDLKNI